MTHHNSTTDGVTPRGYQQEMLEESLRRNIIIALDTGSGKTHIAVLRIKAEVERQPTKVSWFVAPTVALCKQQRSVIQSALPVSVGLISGSQEPDQWKNASLWATALRNNRVMVTTPQVLLDALRHAYVNLGRDVGLLVFDEAHHAVDNHPYNRIMVESYFRLSGAQMDQRPAVLGLTASPIYGGNVEKAFKTIEENLDSTILAPRRHKDELAKYVHRPTFRQVLYNAPDPIAPSFSTNTAALTHMVSSLDILDDPYVHLLKSQLSCARPRSTDYQRIDQKLSKVIQKEDSFTHRGLRDFQRTAEAILYDLGGWAADWYVWKVIEHAKRAANPYNNIISSWKSSEKKYLLSIIDRVAITPVSYYPEDIRDDCTDKVRVLIQTLLTEKYDAEDLNETYSGLVFVQRRDTVLALAELLQHHPFTSFSNSSFKFGCLLGTSDSSRRHSFLDITRLMLKDSHEETLKDFKIGEKTVLISTAVAEEGIDIQACGSVIRWDPPPNIASWTQSRGRARRKRSTYTVLFEKGGGQGNVTKWQELEKQMVMMYNDPSRNLVIEEDTDEDSDEDDELELRVPSTGALLTLHSAVSHLSHFCAAIPSTAHADTLPLYDLDPPEFIEGWHSFDLRFRQNTTIYPGPFGSKVTLPRCLPLQTREFCTERIHRTKISAHRHAAFIAYKALYDAKLLTDNLLPITSVVEPHLEDEVKEMLKDVEQRAGFANVSLQMDPWVPEETKATCWHTYELTIFGLPPLILFNISEQIFLPNDESPTLYRTGHAPIPTKLRFLESVPLSDGRIEQARGYTRMLFWSFNGSRMTWDKDDFPYLVLPLEKDAHWESRRAWLTDHNRSIAATKADEYFANARKFGEAFSYPADLRIVRSGSQFAKEFLFVRWRYEPLDEEEEKAFREHYSRIRDLEITYPLLVVRPLPPRTNFLIPTLNVITMNNKPPRDTLLLPTASAITVLSHAETDYAFLLPSILRFLACHITVSSLRDTLFMSTPLCQVPLPLLLTAMTAPVSSERSNYQRLETLGDTVLKFVTSIQLLAEYPLWHEGYLSKKKDHTVSNGRLAKENIKRKLYRWIIRDRMLGKKWRPSYITPEAKKVEEEKLPTPSIGPEPDKTVNKKQGQQLSTKVLADVIESLIGASYLHGGLYLGYECAKLFDMGIQWHPLPERIEALLSRVEPVEEYPSQLKIVENILGYTFQRKLLLIEALTHASYEQSTNTPSYERMEFLGDSVLDMIITDYLYHVPGKNYSPGHIHLRRSAVVNAHILAYICLSSLTSIDATMPGVSQDGSIDLLPATHHVYLWQCLLHSSPKVLDDQGNTETRYRYHKDDIQEALMSGDVFPWADLIRLQAPKFFSDMVESLIGAVFLDSNGSLNAAHSVIIKLGIMPILERIVRDDVDVLHPVSRLSIWASKRGKDLEYRYEKEKGKVCCIIMVDEKEECRIADIYNGRASQEEVKFMAAERAIKEFHLRDVGVNYADMKKKKHALKTKKKKQVDITEPSRV